MPPFEGRLANSMHGYHDSRLVRGWVTLVDPARIPTFRLREPDDHPLVREQEGGVTPERVTEWLLPIYHPER
jgi:hypothetical protein